MIAFSKGISKNGGTFMSISKPDKKVIVAHYFMAKNLADKKEGFTNKKLQKLLFYAQVWSLVLNDKKLISDKFEAWVHGAAIPTLYGRYKKFGFGEIQEDFDSSEFSALDDKEKKLLDMVWSVYGKYDADYLELLNHSEEPWQNARRGVSPFESSSAEISEKDIKRFYGAKLEKSR